MSFPEQLSAYEIEQRVDVSEGSSVWHAVHKATGRAVAIKVIEKLTKSPIARYGYRHEVDIQQQLNFPFIARLYDVIETQFYLYLIMELASGCSVADLVNQRGQIAESRIQSMLTQLIATLEYLHSNGIVHRDIKGENLMLDQFNNLKMIDFGLSRRQTDPDGMLGTICGSYSYMAPELVRAERYTEKVDIWSAGVVLYSCLYGALPFQDASLARLGQRILYSEPKFGPEVSANAIDLMRRMLCKDPRLRINLAEIKEHPWFNKSEYERIQKVIARSKSLDVGDDLEKLGVDVRKAKDDVEKGEWTEEAASFRILSREKEMAEFGVCGKETEARGLVDFRRPRPTMAAVYLVVAKQLGSPKATTNIAKTKKMIFHKPVLYAGATQHMFRAREASSV